MRLRLHGRIADAKIGAQESRAKFCDMLLHGVGAVAKSLAELAIASRQTPLQWVNGVKTLASRSNKSRLTNITRPSAHALMSVVNHFGERRRSLARASASDDRAGVEAGPKDVGDQALMRGLGTAFPSVRPGLSLSYCGRRRRRPQSV
jgi:hypothetical protein